MKFTVKDAGEVEIGREGNQLTLIEARPNEGWTFEVDEEIEDGEVELEVTFKQAGREVEFEAEIKDDRLAIEIEESWTGVEPGTFTVADAGEVEIQREGDRLVVVGVIASEGWDFDIKHDEAAGDQIEISFVSGNRAADFDAVIVDGELEIEIETKEYIEE